MLRFQSPPLQSVQASRRVPYQTAAAALVMSSSTWVASKIGITENDPVAVKSLDRVDNS